MSSHGTVRIYLQYQKIPVVFNQPDIIKNVLFYVSELISKPTAENQENQAYFKDGNA